MTNSGKKEKKEEDSIIIFVCKFMVGSLLTLFFHILFTGLLVFILGDENVQELERLYFPPDSPVTTVITSLQFCFRLINFTGSVLLFGSLGIFFPFVGLIAVGLYFAISAIVNNMTVSDYARKFPDYIGMWIFGILVGFYGFYEFYPVSPTAFQVIIPLSLLVAVVFLAIEYNQDLPNGLTPFKKQILLTSRLISHFLLGIAYSTILYFSFVICFYEIIFHPLYDVVINQESNPLWVYLMEGTRYFHRNPK